jgi:hypothetical protein
LRTLVPPVWFQALLAAATLFACRRACAEIENVKDACIRAHESAQAHVHAGRLLAARKELIRCAQDRCPQVLRSDCGSSLQGLQAAIPSVVVRVPSGDPDASAVSLLVDGKPAASGLDGRSIELDPGRHVFRVADGSGRAGERSVVVVEGRKNQLIELDFEESRQLSSATEPPYLAYGLGLAGAAALGSFAYFGLSGKQKEHDLERCAPNCSTDDYHAMRRDYMVADSSLAAGVLLMGASAYFFFTHDSRKDGARGWAVVAEQRGASLRFRTRF